MTKKLSYSYTGSTTPLMWKTFGGLLKEIAEKHPKNDALVAVWKNERYTYEEFYNKCVNFAKGLMKIGVQTGDRVAILATNHPEWVIAQFAVPMIGGVLVTINPAFQEHELEYVLNDSDTKVFILMERFKKSEYLQMYYNIRSKLPKIHTSIFLGKEKKEGLINWDDVYALGKDISDDEFNKRAASLDPDDVINMQYTSGTTGFPKGVCLTHHNIINNGFFVGENLKFTDKDRMCIPVPFFHCFGMVLSNMACVSHGATMVIPSESFEAGPVLAAISKEKCTALNGVPTMFIAELEHPSFKDSDLSHLRTGIMAGAPCPIELMKKVNDLMNMKEVTICYGLTECSPVTHQTMTDDPINLRIETVGRPLQHVEVKIVDAEGHVVPVGEQGEICSRGFQVMKEYYKKPKETAETKDSHGWLHSGDLGVVDENGYCRITGRIKDMIIRGGENVYPREIEEFLYTNGKIKDVQCFGIPSEKFGEEVAVWIQLRDGETSTADEIKTFCKGKIAHYKIPQHVKFVDHYPMTASGKIQKFKMREMYAKELGGKA